MGIKDLFLITYKIRMSQTQDGFFQSMFAPRDVFLDEATDMVVQ